MKSFHLDIRQNSRLPHTCLFRCLSEDCREFPSVLHGRAPEERNSSRVQGGHLPPRHQGLHDPRRRLCQQRRHWRHLHLRSGTFRGRELQAEARRPRSSLHGKLGKGHQRLPGIHLALQYWNVLVYCYSACSTTIFSVSQWFGWLHYMW